MCQDGTGLARIDELIVISDLRGSIAGHHAVHP